MLGDGDPASTGRGVQEARQTLQAGQHAVFRLPGRCELRGDRQVGVSCAPGTTGKVRAGGGRLENEELGGEVEGGEEESVTSKSRAKPWRRSSTLPPSPRQTLRDGWRSGGAGEGRPHREGRGGEARGTPHAPGSQTPRSSIVHSTHQTCHCVAGCGWGNSRGRGGGRTGADAGDAAVEDEEEALVGVIGLPLSPSARSSKERCSLTAALSANL